MDDFVRQSFEVRRPLLQAVAEALKNQVSDVLEISHINAQVACAVMTAEQFERLANDASDKNKLLTECSKQITIRVDLLGPKRITDVEEAIHRILPPWTNEWIDDKVARSPFRKMISAIPPQALPSGWTSRKDVPCAFEITIHEASEIQSDPTVDDGVPILTIAEIQKRALVMKGGGVKGLAYVGALEHLSTAYEFNWFIGTSAGAITAVLLGAGYTPDELKAILKSKNFRDFFDAKWYAKPFNLLAYHGIHRADAFTEWLDDLLAQKLQSHSRVQLADLPHRVTVYASRRDKDALKFDTIENNVDAAYAVRCSMSIPIVFVPESHQGVFTYDGGLQNNFPVGQLIKDHPDADFISLYLGPEVYESPPKRSVVLDLISIWTEATDYDVVRRYRDRTVIIDPRPVGTLDFALSDDEKEFLLASGRDSAVRFLKKSVELVTAAKTVREELHQKVLKQRDLTRSKRQFWRGLSLAFLTAVFSYLLFQYAPLTAMVAASAAITTFTRAFLLRFAFKKWRTAILSLIFFGSLVAFIRFYDSRKSQATSQVTPVPPESSAMPSLTADPVLREPFATIQSLVKLLNEASTREKAKEREIDDLRRQVREEKLKVSTVSSPSESELRVIKDADVALQRAKIRSSLAQVYLGIAAYFDASGKISLIENGNVSWRNNIMPYFDASVASTEGFPSLDERLKTTFCFNPSEPNDTSIVAIAPRGNVDKKEIDSLVSDGTSNIIMALVVEKSGIRPNENRDFTREEAIAAIRLGNSPFANGTMVLFRDGSIRFIAPEINVQALEALFDGVGPLVIAEDRPDPPEDIPFMDPQLKRLTNADRERIAFQDTTITIFNNSNKTVRLAYTNTPQPDGNERSEYGHRESSELSPGQTIEDHEVSFGGPYHISIFVDGTWIKTDRWYDLGIVANRQIVVDNASGAFRCTIHFPTDEQ